MAKTDGRLLERDEHLRYLLDVIAGAAAGRSSTVLLAGEAGIGKSSLVRSVLSRVGADLRVVRGGCDDILAPAPLQPLRDAFRGSNGPLERAIARAADPSGLFEAVVAEFEGAVPTLLVVEDVHWADDATLDLLQYIARQPDRAGVVVLLTYRDNEIDLRHPLRGLLGSLKDVRTHRIRLDPLSIDAVRSISAGTGWDADELHELTGGNPFYLTEAIAGPAGAVPPTVLDAVLARIRRLGPETVAVVEQLSVIPTHVVVRHAICLLDGRSNELTRAEEFGVLQMHDDGIGFPHELARRAVEQAIPAARRHALNARVVQALLYHDPVEGVAALVHHAVEANDVDTVLQHAPLAAEQATRAGSHRQALAHFEAVMPYIGRLPAAERADLLDRYAWELHIAHRLSDSLRASGEAVLLLDELDEPVALAETLLRQSRLHYTAGDLDAAVAAVERAVSVAESVGCPTLRAAAVGGHAMMLVLIGQPRAAIPALEQALDDAVAASRTDLIALCTSYLGLALADLGLPGGLEHLRASIDAALSTRDYEAAARGYTNLAEILYRQCRWDELADCLHRGREFSRERGFGSHEYHLEVHEALLLVRRGDWQQAERTLRRHLNSVKNVGIVSVASTSALGRLLARRGDVQAESLLGAAWDVACKQRSLPGLADAGSAYAEWAWLNDRADIAWSIRDELAGRPDCLSSPAFSEVSRYLARANIEVPLLVGGPLGYEQGLRGHWRSAAETWEELRDPYEQALELAESGNTQQTSQALQILDRLGAAPAVVIVRRRLKELGVRRLPRRLRDRTRANPGQLTDRQIDVLMLLADGLTNAEIAEKLVVSVRTVDHHVSAILSRLDAPTRQHAAAAARGIGLIQDREATVRLA